MKKVLFILCACLFGALSGVKAWTAVTPSVGKTYYLYHPGKNMFFYASSSAIGNTGRFYGITSNIADATPIKIETTGDGSYNWTISYYDNANTKGWIYEHDGNTYTASQTSSQSLGIEVGSDNKYFLRHYKSDSEKRYLNGNNDDNTCTFPKTSGGAYKDWQFIAVEDAMAYMANHCASVAETNWVKSSDGWERVTSEDMLKTNPENYFFAIFSANAAGLMVDASSNNTENARPYYKTAVNPLTSSQYLFGIENYESDGFALKSYGLNKYFGNNNDSWNFQNLTEKGANCKLTITLNNGAFEIQSANADWEGRRYWGLYDYTGYIDGQKFAGNKNVAEKGSFLIYRIPKANLDMTSRVTNPTFDIVKDGWDATGGFQNNQIANNQQGDFTGNFWENWNPSAKENKMYQNLTNMPNGIYKVKIAAFVDVLAPNNNSQYVFANSDKTYLETTNPKFYEVCTAVTDNTLSIGLEQTTATAAWMGIDNVSLTYLGGMEDLTAVSGKMNADVYTAQQNAVNAYNSNKTAANYIAATEAIAAAEVSVAAYAKGKSALDKAGEILENTNVYTNEAYAAFAYEASLGKYNDGTWTNEEAENYNSTVFGTGWRTDANIANLLISAWDAPKTGEDRWGTYHINTWSNTADSGNPNMFVPCIEYFVGSENKLEDKVMTATIPGLNPGDKYSVTMYITVSKYNDAYSADAVTSPTGVSLQVGNGDVVNFSGTRINETRHFENTAFTAVGTVDASGNLIIKLNVSETNAHWVYFRNVKYTYVGTPAVMVVNSTAKWGTFCAPFDVAIPSGVTAYTCEGADGSKLTLVDVGETIPANTPVVLNAEEGLASTTFYGVKVPNNTNDLIESGLLVGNVSSVAKAITDKKDGYLLQMNGGKTGFYKMNPSKTYSVGYNRCYLKMGVSGAREAFFFEDDATAISALEAAKAAAGVRKDGKFLENGKIVIVKNGVKYSANGQILK